MDELHAILNAEYQFTPVEFWQGVSDTAKSFITGLLTVDPAQRMTAAEALVHPWLNQPAQDELLQQQQQAQQQQTHEQDGASDMDGVVQHDLLPNMMARMKARSKFRHAVQAVKAINKMRGLHEELRRVHPEEVSHVLHRGDEEMV
ncbi:hypothetical protein BGZ58_003402 [Dissophora ornata]|nr:hypothetical protein BGZ58_003402 [Dissophora ornata]